jgi:hypothetical protein
MNEIRIKSWCELQESLFQDAWNQEICRFRSQYAFRGIPDAQYSLKTSLARLGGDIARRESDLLRNFRKYASREAVEHDSVWHWLSLAQHHGLPTRLLDWTFSPFVAMHFSTADIDRYDTDGAIWAVHYGRAHELLPQVLREELSREGSDVFAVEMLLAVCETLPGLSELSSLPFLLFFEPPSMDDRIVNQFALFSVISDPETQLDRWLVQHPGLWHKVVIPAEIKWEVRDKLDQSNITERVLFPGLDGLSRWLKRYYSPRR